MAKKQPSQADAMDAMFQTMTSCFKQTTDAIRELEKRQEMLEADRSRDLRCTYKAVTGSGKSRLVASFVAEEEQHNPRGARAKAAEAFGISRGRVSQLLNSDKNRNNGK